MDSYSARANTIFCSFVTVLGTASFLNHATTWMPQFDASPQATISLNKVHDLTVNTYLQMDQSILSFNMEADFTSEFNWNQNQLFVYLVATYNNTETNKRNEVTIWDKIVTSKEDAKWTIEKGMVEYPLRDQLKDLRGRKIRLHLRYRTMPLTGVMYEKEVARTSFKSAGEYFRDGTIPTRGYTIPGHTPAQG
mmetsp:Transcript_21256/g.33943  ORF Transcript_21256/g.33943 Transcript_21256/m.33943 type:complete len:193 (-) Transcript_21256:8-586(-)|eukprot:CAMPEP_0115104742 /NCGR_PEP_ID=MMETSP0227-20121206/35515_1 /TAXON_ID=89957 /ORGANISM="Polarella glacialis, Strain CCMP 1383" /LENGTH=192 /DNA_ID=CAMNT_0002501755 /DNA_START=103 /DNA_END=681 /DNA_ORIENTATION=+